MKLLIPLLILLTLACNPVKKVINSESKTIKVVEHYLKTHPFKNDTVTIKGKDSIVYKSSFITLPGFHIDNIVDLKDTASRTEVKKSNNGTLKIRVHDGKAHIDCDADSLEKRIDSAIKEIYNRDNTIIKDRSFINALQRSNDVKDDQIVKLETKVKAIGKKADNWKYRCFSLLFLLLAYGGYKLFRFFKPSVRIG